MKLKSNILYYLLILMIILSWNIQMNKSIDIISKTDILLCYMREINPDIICLQESCIYTNKNLCALGYTCHSSTLTHMGYCSILVKNNILIDNYTSILHTGQLISINGINIINCHLTPYKSNHKKRLEQLKKMDNPLTIVVGDFNTTDDESFILTHISDVSKDSGYTWNSKYFDPNLSEQHRMDRVYASDDIIVNRCKVEKILFSDHYPIIIDISL